MRKFNQSDTLNFHHRWYFFATDKLVADRELTIYAMNPDKCLIYMFVLNGSLPFVPESFVRTQAAFLL